MAPEVVLREGYSKPADWWSFGIFTFDLLTGRSPFHSNQGKQATKDRIVKARFQPPKIMTPEALDFVRKLLRRKPNLRLGASAGASELKQHLFFKGTDWDKVVKREYEPPFRPEILNETDVQHFDEQFTSRSPRESNAPVNPKNTPSPSSGPVDYFEDFDYVAEEFLIQEVQARKASSVSSKSDSAISSASSHCDSCSRPTGLDAIEQICDHIRLWNHGI